MPITDRDRHKAIQVSQLASNEPDMTGTAKDAIAAVHQRTYVIHCQDAATAGTAITETVLAHIRNKSKVVDVTVSAPIAVAADNTDYVTFTVSKRTGAGGATTVATADTRAASLNALAAFVPETITLTATTANLQLAAGDVVTFAAAKAGSGKALVAATSYLTITLVVEEN